MSGPGRRAGSPDTRGEILAAARSIFGEMGYDRATVRAIAYEAGVDPSLIYHYFGAKEDLFAASIDLPIPPARVLREVLGEGVDGLGQRLAVTFFAVWESEEARRSLLGVLRSAMTGDDRAANAFRQFLTSVILDEISPLLPRENARLRALLMASHLVGIAMTRYVMRLEPIASIAVEDIVRLVAPRIQSYVE